MNSYKIDVRNLKADQVRAVQDALFELGYSWHGTSTDYQQLCSNFYFAEKNGWIMYCEGGRLF